MKYGLISAILHYFQRKSQGLAVVVSDHTYAYLRLRSDIVTEVETPADLILSSQTDTHRTCMPICTAR